MNKQTDYNEQVDGISFFAKKYSGMTTGFTMMVGFTTIYLLLF